MRRSFGAPIGSGRKTPPLPARRERPFPIGERAHLERPWELGDIESHAEIAIVGLASAKLVTLEDLPAAHARERSQRLLEGGEGLMERAFFVADLLGRTADTAQ